MTTKDAFTTNVMEVPLGTGTGFVWDSDGHIVTNYHVVKDAKSAQVAIITRVLISQDSQQRQKQQRPLATESSDKKIKRNLAQYGRTIYKATVVGTDPDKDIAVLKIDAPRSDLRPIFLGSSSDLRVGQQALAIGNPFGLDHTLTVGVISGLGREVRAPSGRPISNVVQTDAAINPGNSGGPLLDSSGRMIGMNTAIYSPSGTSSGIGFAIPVGTLRYIVELLIKDGKVIRPIIGISYLESSQAKTLGINKGVLVLDVPKGSPAYVAGMRGTQRTEEGLLIIGDIIVKVGPEPIDTEASLFQALENYRVGNKVDITVLRLNNRAAAGSEAVMTNSKTKIITTTLQASPQAAKNINMEE
mmetsp:Transcript_39643/g.92753  ORF Transcript_39643/g.92753 Transcript_39643/m.92753 type:complete len:358 (-) Transcript_39643:383-1456(-)|eukprot:CAMPEP_0113313984 /NCGR_PEP_ID=MMETSP0010_2-20120614/10213_1 /TAXON_ID=216773 ORGANISM="Corethron hystrix, Strain 308" /NCGR_SAMPLE_ID=MMETSP0010_2 /ASSEMBLY_ACC=CAM_ASM_000155 /LENGTH=357 /DNA_ID=CAMNT_0000170153 /DNA_START=840 /DNA_END=1913 /DNA_ORIENTATION=+ /assembly_acc=CAM_ASM_000155